ncbi:unnamed protein product [Lactuca virosa]|uniref:Uncharacterized protein n=1 Tax=Lactuca virosa TaxID=75947 RepID=A0AAU9NZ83_9ASTR|nr:unnamed protein product [Lactuca virosa]
MKNTSTIPPLAGSRSSLLTPSPVHRRFSGCLLSLAYMPSTHRLLSSHTTNPRENSRKTHKSTTLTHLLIFLFYLDISDFYDFMLETAIPYSRLSDEELQVAFISDI